MDNTNEIRFRAYDNRIEDWSKDSFDADVDEEIVTSKPSLLVINTMYNRQSINTGDQYSFQLSAFMLDNDGVEIFEGDILEHTLIDGTKRFYKIWREAGGLVVNIHQDDFYKPVKLIQFWEGLSNMQTASFIKNCRVIGNVIDNPELLECRTA